MIEVKNLSFGYSGTYVLDNISTTFEQGRVYGLLGANGVGKSTLFKLLCGLLTTKHGTIDVDGYSPSLRQPGFLSKLFYIPEDFEGPAVSIKNYAAGIAPFYPNYDEELLRTLLNDFEIDINRKFTTLSLGQRKRAIICIALAMNTEYLLLDVENLLDHIMILDKRAVLLDKSVADIQNEYRFEVSATAPEDALFVEPGLGGCSYIAENKSGEESRINIELLFNYINSKK